MHAQNRLALLLACCYPCLMLTATAQDAAPAGDWRTKAEATDYR